MSDTLQEYRDAAEAEFVRHAGVQPDSFTVTTDHLHAVPHHLVRAKVGDMVIEDSVTLEEAYSTYPRPATVLFVYTARRMAMVYDMKKDTK